jgi:hypothetical protein
MKLDFLTSLEGLGPCGLRPVIDTLSDTYPVMVFADWKALAIELIDDGYVTQKGNGQYMITPAGVEAVQKGQSFFDEVDAQDDEPEADDIDDEPTTIKASPKAHRPAADHQWRKPFSPKAPYQETGKRAEPIEPKREQEAAKREPSAVVQLKPGDYYAGKISASQEREFIKIPMKDSSAELKQMTIDDLLIVFTLGKEAETIIETRLKAFGFERKAASNE